MQGWSQPYLIGPRDAENIKRVAIVANKPVVARNYLRIAAADAVVKAAAHWSSQNTVPGK